MKQRVPKDHLQVWWLARITHRSQHMVVSWLWFITAKGYNAKSAKEKGPWGQVWRTPSTGFQESPPTGDIQDTPHYSSNKIQKHTWNVYWRSSSETQNPVFLLDTGNVDTICLAHNKIPDSQKESSVRCKRHWLYKQFSHSKPPLSVRERWELPKSKFPATSPGPALLVQACLSKASISDLLPYLFSAQIQKQRSSPWRRLTGQVPLWIKDTIRKRL